MTDGDSNRITRRGYLTYGAAGTAVALAGCAGEEVEDIDDEAGTDDDEAADGDDSHIQITQTQNPTTLDPHDHRETTTDNVLFQAYEVSIGRDRDGNLVDQLVTDWEVLDEERYRLEIRDGVSFHEGDELTPGDVAFSINRVVDEDAGNLQSPQADQLAGVTGAEVEDGDVIVHTAEANPMVFANLASYCPIVQEEWVMDRASEEVAQEINGTGPYQLEEFVDGEYTDFTSFPDYWDGEAEIDTVAALFEGIRPGTVAKTWGQGHWAYGQRASEEMGETAKGGHNNLIIGAEYDRLSGSSVFYGDVQVDIEKK